MDLDLHNLNPEILNSIEKEVFESLPNSQHDGIIDLAYASLDQYPALGILFARAALDPARHIGISSTLAFLQHSYFSGSCRTPTIFSCQ
jgi:hypothetical protein